MELCGCYISPKNAGFSSDELTIFQQSPQCIPSCFAARVRYAAGGVAVPCQQSLCIVDDINVSGTTTTVSQVCPDRCSKRFECVCYIHINGKTIDNSTCNTVYEIAPDGKITDTIHNQAPSASTNVSNFMSALTSKTAIITLIVITILITIGTFTLLILQHRRGQTRAKFRKTSY